MLKKLLKKNQGFTLVEIIIVLAIVALIFVIVFLAVAAAQRGQRDTARKDNVNRMIAAIGQVEGNSNGTAPTIAAPGGGCPAACKWNAGAPAGEAQWTLAIANPVTAIVNGAPNVNGKNMGWTAASPDVTKCPTVTGAAGYVSVFLDDGVTMYCKTY